MKALKSKTLEGQLIVSRYNLQEVKKYVESIKKIQHEATLQDNRGGVEGGASNGQDSENPIE